MEYIKLTAWVPVFPILSEEKAEHEYYFSCLRGFRDSVENIFPIIEKRIDSVSVGLKTPPTSIFNQIVNLNIHRPVKFSNFVKFECVLKYDLAELKFVGNKREIGIGDLIAVGAVRLSSSIQDLFILAGLAYPGCMHTDIGQVFYKNVPMNIIGAVEGLDFYSLRENPWPKLNTIEISKVIKWENNLGLFDKGYGQNSIQRALASYTHILRQSVVDTYEMLFWSMQGLEAFYCHGKGELRNQLKEKTKLFLGDWNDNKNIIGHLYDLRSKFVHGEFPIKRWNNNRNIDESLADKEHDKLNTSNTLAVCILLASIQKCILEDIIDINFTYLIKATKSQNIN